MVSTVNIKPEHISPRTFYERFRESMLANTPDWKDLIAEDVTMSSPLAETVGRNVFIEMNEPFFNLTSSVVAHEVIYLEDRVVARSTVVISVAGMPDVPLPFAEWVTVREGKMTDLKVYFDPSVLQPLLREITPT